MEGNCTKNEPKPSTNAVIEAINQVRESLMVAYDAGYADAFASLVTDDVIFMHNTRNLSTGRDRIHEIYLNYFSGIDANMTISPTELEVKGDCAFERGSFESIRYLKDDNQRLRQDAIYMIIWRRIAEQAWKIVRHIYVGDYKPLEDGLEAGLQVTKYPYRYET